MAKLSRSKLGVPGRARALEARAVTRSDSPSGSGSALRLWRRTSAGTQCGRCIGRDRRTGDLRARAWGGGEALGGIRTQTLTSPPPPHSRSGQIVEGVLVSGAQGEMPFELAAQHFCTELVQRNLFLVESPAPLPPPPGQHRPDPVAQGELGGERPVGTATSRGRGHTGRRRALRTALHSGSPPFC